MAKSEVNRGTPTPTIPPSPLSVKGSHKGSLSLKSSPYSSNNKRAINQHEVVNNLNVHYKKLGSAKSRIDSSVPKSWTSSTIKKDQLKRQAIEKQLKKPGGGKKTSSRPNSRNTVGTDADELNLDMDEDLANYGIVDNHAPRSTPHTPVKAYRPRSVYSEQQHTGRPRTSQSQLYSTATSYRNTKNAERMGTGDYRTQTPRKDSADILDKRAEKFTESNKPYTPRTLKTTATSRLSQSRNYNPPKKGRASNKGHGATGASDRNQYSNESASNNANFLRYKEQLEHMEQGETQQEARAQRAEDHLRWVEDQALRVHSLNIDDVEDDELRPMSTSLSGTKRGQTKQMGRTQDLNVSFGNESLRSMTYRTPEQVSKRMQEEEEELRYLEFVTDVTNDVLNRGIYTNSVLKQVFQSHVEKNKGRLEEGRMRHLMKQLQEDLAIPDDPSGDI